LVPINAQTSSIMLSTRSADSSQFRQLPQDCVASRGGRSPRLGWWSSHAPPHNRIRIKWPTSFIVAQLVAPQSRQCDEVHKKAGFSDWPPVLLDQAGGNRQTIWRQPLRCTFIFCHRIARTPMKNGPMSSDQSLNSSSMSRGHQADHETKAGSCISRVFAIRSTSLVPRGFEPVM